MNEKDLSIYHEDKEDKPIPLIVAKKWGFQLRFVIEDQQYWFSIKDWISGLTNVVDPKRAWQSIRMAPEMASVLKEVRRITIPGTKGSRSQVINDKGLYTIAAYLRPRNKQTALIEIKDFLAKAGAFLDLVRRDEQFRAEVGATAGAEAVVNATINHYQKMGRDDTWIRARLEGAVTRNQFTSALKSAILNASNDLYWKSTEKIYSGLWEKTTAELRSDLGLSKKDKTRDHFGEYALIYTRLAEKLAIDKLKDVEFVYEELGMEIVYSAAKIIHAQAEATAKALGMDLVTEQPLLNNGKH